MKPLKTIGVLGMALGFLTGGGLINKAQAYFLKEGATVLGHLELNYFPVPSMANGQEVTSVIVHEEGDDVVVDLKNAPDGPPLKTFLLKDKKNAVENFDYGFQLSDKGQYFSTEDTKSHVMGGKGDDDITTKAGSWIEGNDGNDVLHLTGIDDGGIIDGGRGDDLIVGSSGADIMSGGDGDDIFVSDPDAKCDVVDGGGGNDKTNLLGPITNVEIKASNPQEAEEMWQEALSLQVQRYVSYIGAGPNVKLMPSAAAR